jgi:hypothetical protein
MSEVKANDEVTRRDSSASDSSAKENRASRTDLTRMVEVERGSFGRVLVSSTTGGLAFKQTLDPRHRDDLMSEYEIYRRIAQPLRKAKFRVPKPLKFYNSVPELKARYEVKLDTEGPLFSMYCVQSASVAMANVIRHNFVPERARSSFVGLRLCRLYFGVDTPLFLSKRQRSQFVNTSNYQLCSKDVDFLRDNGVIPSVFTCPTIATGMGEALAVFHHELKLDARDIEFVMGGDEEELASLWVIDFNQVKPWKSIDDLVSAHLTNDPYYPRPGSELWNAFVAGYVATSSNAPADANAFIKALVEVEKERAKNDQNK